ncbi:hypothetical protein [Mycolicibacterium mageritense]|uniref:Uncharacterized protein n=1 Tax=Mycolicibacterium mageritense TaxID=53462 RepID=A0ABM7I2T4_MYCME|nr:hypothetical protein [Mycolicibacterium mageritense]MCC9185418.1 hypothetical protein [Mycolicibacterium mageritense]BBX37201.1 hypothetical protein MMAGJ_64830 [Mycolicibacterium mageritense]
MSQRDSRQYVADVLNGAIAAKGAAVMEINIVTYVVDDIDVVIVHQICSRIDGPAPR